MVGCYKIEIIYNKRKGLFTQHHRKHLSNIKVIRHVIKSIKAPNGLIRLVDHTGKSDGKCLVFCLIRKFKEIEKIIQNTYL